MYKGLFYLAQELKLKGLMLKEFHEIPIGGDVGVDRTNIWMTENVCWPSMKKAVKDFVIQCVVCQSIKYSIEAPYDCFNRWKFQHPFGRI